MQKRSGSPTRKLFEPGPFSPLIKSWAAGRRFTSSSSPLPGSQGVGRKAPPSIALAPIPHPRLLSKSHLININPVWCKGTCYELQDTHFTLMALKLALKVSGTEDKRANIMTKDVPIALNHSGSSKCLGAVSRNSG